MQFTGATPTDDPANNRIVIPGGGGGGGGGLVVPAPSPVASWAVVGGGSLVQQGSFLKFDSVVSSPQSDFLAPIPAGVVPGGPWSITLAALAQAVGGTTYPEFGIVLADGVTLGTSIALYAGWYQYGGNVLSLGAWAEILATQTRPAVYYGTNANDLPQGVPVLLRLLCDGTSYIYQTSTTGGASWRTYLTNTKATVAASGMGAATRYGFSAGAANGGGRVNGLVTGLVMAAIPQAAISNVVVGGGLMTVTTATPHGLATGDTCSLSAIVSTGAAVPNALYPVFPDEVVVTSPTSILVVLAGSQSLAYVSGGFVTKTN